MNLGIENFTYSDLYDYDRLRELASSFDRFVRQRDAALFERFAAYRAAPGSLTPPQESELLIAVSRELGVFIAQLFPVDGGPAQLRQRAQRDAQVARFKKEFVAKRVAKVASPAAVDSAPIDALIRTIAGGEFERDPELALACTANKLLDIEREYPRGAKAAAPSAETRASLGQLRESLRASHTFDDSLVKHEPVESPDAVAR